MDWLLLATLLAAPGDVLHGGGRFDLRASSQTVANLEPTPVNLTVDLELTPPELGGNTESAAIHCVADPSAGSADHKICFYFEVTDEQGGDEASALKVIHKGHGDAMFAALFNDGVGFEAASFYNGSRGIIATNQWIPGTPVTYDLSGNTLFQSVWGYDGTGGSKVAPLYGSFYAALSLGRSFSVRLQDTGADGFAWDTPEFLIRDYSLARTHWEVQNSGNQTMASVVATAGSTDEAAPYLTLRGSYYSGSASDKDIDFVPQMSGGVVGLAINMGSSGAESLEYLFGTTDFTAYNNLALDNSATGADYNSPTLNLQGNNYNGADYTADAAVQLMAADDPYLRISVDDDLTSGNGSLTAVLDIHDDAVLFSNDNTADIGSFAANRPRHTYQAGGEYHYLHNLPTDDATPDVSAGDRFLTGNSSAPVEITDLDNPQVGFEITIYVGGTPTNPPTITDGGNFSLEGNWTPDSVGDSITLYVYADNTYWEVRRKDN